jgi:ubiquinone/menaquinone biosynthesis C-methylase UbiE
MSDAGFMFNDGAAYERLMGRWSRLVGDQFLDWIAVPKGARWLDVGCGNGAFTETLIERCAPASVAAVDPSEGQLAYARTRPGAKMAQFRVGDAQTLPFDNGGFDAAVMALVISFVPDAAKAVAEMARVVRPGGLVATYMWDFDDAGVPLSPIYKAMEAMGLPRSAPPGATNARREVMQRLWKGANLQSIETRVIRIPVVFADFDDFWASNMVPVGPQGQVLKQMSPAALEELRKRLRQQLPTAADGRIAYAAFANAVKGRVPG